MAQTDVRTLHPLWSASAQASGAERRSVAQALRNSAWRPDGARAVPRWHEGRSCGAAAAAALAVAFGNGLIASPALANACVASGSGFICSGDLSQGLNFNNGGKYTPGMSSSSAAGTSFITIKNLSKDINGSTTINIPNSNQLPFSKIYSDQNHIVYAWSGNALNVQALDQRLDWRNGRPPLEPMLAVSVNNRISVAEDAAKLGVGIAVQSQGINSTGGSGDGGSAGYGRNARPVLLTLAPPRLPGPKDGRTLIYGSPAIYAAAIGGRGGTGATGSGSGGRGGDGAEGSDVFLTVSPGWFAQSPQAGVLLLSKGGSGGGGGDGVFGDGGRAGNGAAGRNVTFTTACDAPGASCAEYDAIKARTSGSGAPGIQLLSQGGNGGNGGDSDSFSGGGRGGLGGFGGAVTAAGSWDVATKGPNAAGFVAQSLGGTGGQGGNGGLFGDGGGGGNSGTAGPVSVTANAAFVSTLGPDSPGMVVQSVAGHGGAAGDQYGFVSFSGSGGSAGKGGTVALQSYASAVTTVSGSSPGYVVQSVGGGGGHGGGGVSAFYGKGSKGGSGGDSSDVSATVVFGSVTTSGSDSPGVLAQSIAGGGGNGGTTVSIAAVGGRGGAASNAGRVYVDVSSAFAAPGAGLLIETGSAASGAIQASTSAACPVNGCSPGVVAQSIGGGGGNAGSGGGWFAFGGDGGGGGHGDEAEVQIYGATFVQTLLARSEGLLVQSIGGGGGTGGGAVSAGSDASAAVGGSGGDGGDGDRAAVRSVTVNTSGGVAAPKVFTQGAESPGVVVQSIGGGGGRGGFAASTSWPGLSPVPVSVAIGGSGGKGGSGGPAEYATFDGDAPPDFCCAIVQTGGDSSPGVQIKSIGGGGGSGGVTVSAAGAAVSGAIAIGGSGGDGGHGGPASARTDATIVTQGAESPALEVKSVGGGGGDGGLTIAGAAGLGAGAVSVAVGGSGGGGGHSDAVTVTNYGRLTTSGEKSDGLTAQSVGGGGGRGSLTIAAAGTVALKGGASIAVAVGASGGDGGDAGPVSVVNAGALKATGVDSRALVARSVGGGGGSGSVAVSAAVTIPADDIGVSVGVALGGDGGAAGDGGDVSVVNSGTLVTSAPDNEDDADPKHTKGQGLLAQSVGGGGGSGGWAGNLSATFDSQQAKGSIAIGVGMGGAGGAGGDAGVVSVANSGAITTWNPNSEGILAQSIAGGGGDAGGVANLTIAGNAKKQSQSVNGAINIGQSGGGGGKAGAVTVSNTAAIATNALKSAAISAKSAGGGGGDAGIIANLNIGLSLDWYPVNIGVTLGGDGGTGRAGGPVTVTSSGALTTAGDNSPGIAAWSIGGGGGNANYTVSVSGSQPASNNESTSLQAAVGGDGGEAADGAAVVVENDGGIRTGALTSDGASALSGEASHGIVAMSIGGGGGSAMATTAANPGGDWKIGVTVGGTGATGGDGGAVTVTNRGAVATLGNGAAGVVARSIGGGGGDSQATTVGVAVGGENPPTNNHRASVNVSVGNECGEGGVGGAVTVANFGAITTSPAPSDSEPVAIPQSSRGPLNSYGVFAQSVGGGGGFGGAAAQYFPKLTNEKLSGNINVNVGGKGGSGGVGGPVSVTNAGLIRTYQISSYGVAAQSVGGGGGGGGASTNVAGVISSGEAGTARDFNIGVSVGGEGGTGNNAGPVTVANTGVVETYGVSAHALFAQSVGGGGGDGGSAAAYTIGEFDKNQSVQNQKVFSIQVAVGGKGGATGAGGTVSVDNRQTLKTFADDAAGIFAQSVGGGGGTGGNGSQASSALMSTVSATVGGEGGSAGRGGKVSVAHANFGIVTEGGNAPGIYAQSVGGGGGRGGVGVYVPGVDVPIPGAAGGSGDGGPVDVFAAYGGVTTHGDGRAFGIFAQSVGGGGGETGGVSVGVVDTVYPAEGFAVIASPVGSVDKPGNGDGGPVQVKLVRNNVTTTGDDAVGVFAQSVGGGGGVGGTTDCASPPCAYWVGSGSGSGDAGSVRVEMEEGAAIETSGRYSHAIFAQSAAGGGKVGGVGVSVGGPVTIDVNGRVVAAGADASAIFALSSGPGGRGQIAIDVAEGSVVSGGAGNAAAVRIIDGEDNLVTNRGLITTALEERGVAIRVDRSQSTTEGKPRTQVANYGVMIGEALAGASASLIIDNVAGTAMVAGPRMLLGEGGALDNAGELVLGGAARDAAEPEEAAAAALSASPAGAPASLNHVLDGDFAQSETGRTIAVVRHGMDHDAPLLEVTGTADLSGVFEVDLVPEPDLLAADARSFTAIRAAGGFAPDSDARLLVQTRPFATAEVAFAGQDARVTYAIDFANEAALAALNDNQDSVAIALEALRGFAPTATPLMSVAATRNIAAYGDALDRLGPEPYAANQIGVLFSALNFSESMLDCEKAKGVVRTADGTGCGWLQIGGRGFERDATSEVNRYKDDRWGLSGGLEHRAADDWTFGAGFGYERVASSLGGFSDTDGHQAHAGVMARLERGGWLFAAGLTGGWAWLDADRDTGADGVARADQDIGFLTGRVRAGRRLEVEGFRLEPRVDLAATVVRMDDFSEDGAGDASLEVESRTETYFSVHPGIDLARSFSVGADWLLEPRATIAVTHFLDDDDPGARATFADFPGAGVIAASSTLDRTYLDLSLGVDLVRSGGLALRASGVAQFGENTEAFGGSLAVNWSF